MNTLVQPIKDQQTVTAEGKSVRKQIADLVIDRRLSLEDERGEVVEVYRPAWNLNPDPLVYVYQALVRPGAVKGWIVHEKQEDRIFISQGVMRWVFFDNRPESPTYQLLNDFTFSDRSRALIVIPRGVFHAVKNIGQQDATFINMPTRPYNHEDPDKYRLPLKNDLIPFDFNDGPGW